MPEKPALPPPRYDRREPCAQCPYRLDAPLAKWHADHFLRLLEHEAKPEASPVYNCHNQDGNACVGWLLDQRDRNVVSINLRLQLRRHPGLVTQLHEATDGGHDRFESVREMCTANLLAMTRDGSDD